MWKEAYWIGLPQCEMEQWPILANDLTGRFAYYRIGFTCPAGSELSIDITANSRYRLWTNGTPVQSGPCKGDLTRHYYDTATLTSYLRAGKNVVAVQVLYNEATAPQYSERGGIVSVYTPGGGHRLAVEGAVYDGDGNLIADIATGRAEWKVYLDGAFHLAEEEFLLNFGAAQETIDFHVTPIGWKRIDFDDHEWGYAPKLEPVCQSEFERSVGLMPRFPLRERPIPLLYEREERFIREILSCSKEYTGLLEQKSIHLCPREHCEILLDAGVESCGYPIYQFIGGNGAGVHITYAERFTGSEQQIPLDDAAHGVCEGVTDVVTLSGGQVVYEPFWMRTFRFVKLDIQCAAEELEVFAPIYRKTGYPLEIRSDITSSVSRVKEVWDMCVRTLACCMGETYMDCPYYEQMQFSMDTRLQVLFYGVLGNDHALTEKALLDFHCSMIPEGLIHGKYPSSYPQIISTFSMHYIYMLEEFYLQTGDISSVRRYLPDIDRILDYYDRQIGEDHLVGRLGYWEFVDWQEAWKATSGVPAALQEGPSTIINLMYAYGLQCGAVLYEAAGRAGIVKEYLARKKKILDQVERLCWDENRSMYREGPSFQQFTQHAQSWAVVAGLAVGEKAKRVLTAAMEKEDVLVCSFSTAYEWFRALELSGMYDHAFASLNRWRELPERGYTTCPEEPKNERSECHAWSALPLYEFMRSIAGIRLDQGNSSRIIVQPHLGDLPNLEGYASTPKGPVKFSYRREAGIWNYNVCIPTGMTGCFVTPDGEQSELTGGKWQCIRMHIDETELKLTEVDVYKEERGIYSKI